MGYGQLIYGSVSYSQEQRQEADINTYTPDLMKYLPPYYHKSKVVHNLQGVLGNEIGLLNYNLQDVKNQFFISTATWGLDLWEEEYGIPVDPNKPFLTRREILLAKIRGSGTTTKLMIANMAMAFSGGEVQIIEYPSEYRFEIQFIGIKGIPQNMAGLIAAIEDIKPAHLAYSFKYTYTVWQALDTLSWSQIAHKTWGELRTYEEG